MLTKNWHTLISKAFLYGSGKYSSVTLKTFGGSSKTFSTNVFFDALNDALFYEMDSLGSTQGNGLVFGDGTTSPTLDDYQLSGTTHSSIGLSTSVGVTYDCAGNVKKTAVCTITNNGTEEITISEMGYVGYIKQGTTSAYNHYLLDRTLLDSPITIPAGGVGQITYTIEFNIG